MRGSLSLSHTLLVTKAIAGGRTLARDSFLFFLGP